MISSSTKEEIDEWSSNCRRNQIDVLKRLNKSIDKYKQSKTSIQGQIEDIRFRIEALSSSEVTRIVKMSEETHATAAKMSDAIRKLDNEQSRILEVIQLLGRVERIKELYESVNSSVRTQINAKKLVEACQNVHDLLHFPEMSLKAYETRYPDPEGTSLKERLATAQDSLAKNVMNDIDEILKKEPFSPADLLQAFKLLEMLNRTKEGVIRYSAFLNQQGENYLKTLMKSASIKQDLFYSVQLGKMFDYAAKSLTWSFEHVIIGDDASCGEHRQIVYMSYLQMVEDLVNTFIVEGFIVDKKLNGDDFCKQLPVLDLTLAEIALISGQLENFLLFVREFTPKANSHQSSPLVSSTSSSLYQCETIFDVLNKLLVIYPKLETIYVEAGMRKAIEVNQPIDDGTLTSCVDDVFFLAKKCTMRSFSLHQSDVILAVCEVVHKHLSSVFGQTLGKSLKSLPGTLSDERAKSYMMNVNNLFAAVDFLQKLGEELLDVFEQLVSPDSSPSMYSLPASIGEPIPNLLFVMQKFEHIMTAYNQLTCQFEQIAKQSLQALINHHIKGKLKKLLAAIFKDVQFVGNEENSDLISQKYIAGHFELIHAIDACLTDATRLELYKLIASEIVKFWTKLVLSSKFNQFGALQLDRDVRKMVGFFVENSDFQIREVFSELITISSVLLCDTQDEAKDTYQSLASGIDKLLSLRIDW